MDKLEKVCVNSGNVDPGSLLQDKKQSADPEDIIMRIDALIEGLTEVFNGHSVDIKTLQDELANTNVEVGDVNHQKKELLDKFKKIEKELSDLKQKAKNDSIQLVEKERQIILILSSQGDLNDRLTSVHKSLTAIAEDSSLGISQ